MSQVTDKLQQFLTVAAAEIKVPNHNSKSFANWNPDFESMPKTTLKRWFSALDKANKATKLKPGPYAKFMRKVAGLLKKQGVDVGYSSTGRLPSTKKPGNKPVTAPNSTKSTGKAKEIVFYGGDVYTKTDSMHSGLETTTGKRYDLGYLQKDLDKGVTVTIRPAVGKERATWRKQHNVK